MIQLSPTTIIDIDRIREKLKALPPAAGDAGVEQASNYLINVLVRKEIPPYKYVSRREAYGRTFQSDKQRRWFFWALRSGKLVIPYRRRSPRGGLAASWIITGSGMERKLENRLPAAYWVYSQNQAKQLGLAGWKRISAILSQYEKNIVASFERGVRSAIARLGLQ